MFTWTQNKLIICGLMLAVISLGPIMESQGRLINAARQGAVKAKPLVGGVNKGLSPPVAGLTTDPSLLPYIGSGLCFGCGLIETIDYTDPVTGERILTDTTGGVYFDSHTTGRMFGTIKMQGLGTLPDSTLIEMHVGLQMLMETSSAGPLDMNFRFAGTTLSTTPFVVTVDDVTDPLAAFRLLQIPILPADGASGLHALLPQAGLYDVRIDFNIPDYILPPGDTLAVIESYEISWNVVPEPAALLPLLAAMGLMAGRQRKNRTR